LILRVKTLKANGNFFHKAEKTQKKNSSWERVTSEEGQKLPEGLEIGGKVSPQQITFNWRGLLTQNRPACEVGVHFP